MSLKPEQVAVIGAGIVGSAVAHALASQGRRVTLIDRAPPGLGGASFGNVAHIAAELVQPLPSRQLLAGFWRELYGLGGVLDIPLRRLPAFAPWACRFAAAAFHRERNTEHLRPLVQPAAAEYQSLLGRIGRPELLRCNGHYQVWFGKAAVQRAAGEAALMHRLHIPTGPVEPGVLEAISRAARASRVAGLHFPQTAHVVDPLKVVQALADAAVAHGARWQHAQVDALQPGAGGIEVVCAGRSQLFETVIVCAGPWAPPLLAPFGLKAPLETAHGYHVDLEHHAAHVEAPLIYVDRHILVTPLQGRLRASSFMEFSGLHSGMDPRKPRRLRRDLQNLGYHCESEGPAWKGGRPVLPDYLPGIGRAPGPHRLFYAIGHQHLGLTMAPITARLVADLVAGRPTTIDVSPFDLRRFA